MERVCPWDGANDGEGTAMSLLQSAAGAFGKMRLPTPTGALDWGDVIEEEEDQGLD